MARKNVGSIRKVTLDGITYSAGSEDESEETRGKYATTAIVHSGGVIAQQILQSRMVSVILVVDDEEAQAIEALADGDDNFPMSYTTAANVTKSAVGFINISSTRSNLTGKMTIEMHPENNQWETF